jgi:hypothetical protein
MDEITEFLFHCNLFLKVLILNLISWYVKISMKMMLKYNLNSLRGIMNNSYTAMIKKVGQWWIGWNVEIPGINCQERTQKNYLRALEMLYKKHWK